MQNCNVAAVPQPVGDSRNAEVKPMFPWMAHRFSRQLRSSGGFTLPELMIVVMIMLILVAVAIMSINGYRSRTGSAAAESNVRAALPAIMTYYSENSTFVGMDVAALQAFDSGVSPSLTITNTTVSHYCVSDTVEGVSAYQDGPGAQIAGGTCA